MPSVYRLAGTMTTCLPFSKVEMRLPYTFLAETEFLAVFFFTIAFTLVTNFSPGFALTETTFFTAGFFKPKTSKVFETLEVFGLLRFLCLGH